MDIIGEFAAVPAITILCALIAQAYKTMTNYDNKNIPVICGVCGAILGVLSLYLISGLLPADNPLTAAAIGAVSGWASTGIHQVKKQLVEKPPDA